MPKKSATEVQPSWSSQLIALFGLYVAGTLIAYFVPSVPNSTSGIFARLTTVNFHQVLALTLTTAALVVFLAYYRAKLFFSTRWLIAAIVYNFLILFVKFTVSTNEIVNSHSQSALTFHYILSIGLLVSLVYLVMFALFYLFFSGKIISRSVHRALITTTDSKALLAVGLFVVATLVRILVFRLPILSSTSASSYLTDVFKANNTLLSALIFVMIIAAVEAFAQVRRRSDLKYFLVSGLVMILSFHIWWAIFVYRGY